MKEHKLRHLGRKSRTASSSDIRPYTLRVYRDNGGGLWTFEGDDGQLYLAVKSHEWSERQRLAVIAAQADGAGYRGSSSTPRRRPRVA